MAKCGHKCEVYSRVVGYYRPVSDWNVGKREEFNDRRTYKANIARLKAEAKAVEEQCERV